MGIKSQGCNSRSNTSVNNTFWGVSLKREYWTCCCAALSQVDKIVEFGTKEWLPIFQKLESELSQKFKKLKKVLGDLSSTYSRYKDFCQPSKLEGEAKQLLDQALVTCSEALLLRALASADVEGEVRAQMRRMAEQKVTQIHPALHAAAQRALKRQR